jgi:hypothetical protein
MNALRSAGKRYGGLEKGSCAIFTTKNLPALAQLRVAHCLTTAIGQSLSIHHLLK